MERLLYLLIWFDKFIALLRFDASRNRLNYRNHCVYAVKCAEIPFESKRYNLKKIEASSIEREKKTQQKNVQLNTQYTCVSGYHQVMKLFVFKVHMPTEFHFVSDNWHRHFPNSLSREWIRFQEHRKKRRTNARARNDIKLNYWNILQNQIKLDTSNWLNMSLCYLRIINVFGAAQWWRDEWCRRRVHVQDMMLETLWITFFMRVHLGNIVVKLIFCSTEHAEWVNEHAQNHSCC